MIYKCPLLPTKLQNPQCIIHRKVDCGKPPRNGSVTNGRWLDNSTWAGNNATLICPSGYYITGTSEIYCSFTVKWTLTEAKYIHIDDNTGLYVVIGCAVSIIILLIVVYKLRYEINVCLYNKFGFRFRKQNEDDSKQYDAFVSYNVPVTESSIMITIRKRRPYPKCCGPLIHLGRAFLKFYLTKINLKSLRRKSCRLTS